MAGPILLVHDDLAAIAAIKRLLAREGYEVILATSAADALIAFGHHLPSVVLLAPSVESDRGHVVLDELKEHPDGKLARVILLGESIPGYALPMAAMPPDDQLVETINELAMSTGDGWEVREPPRTVPTPSELEAQEQERPAEEPVAPQPAESGDWRTSRPPDIEQPVRPPAEPVAPIESAPEASADGPDLEGALFGDLPALEDEMHRAIEAEAMASVESSLANRPVDDELQRLEDEVRAEAARRRQQAAAGAAPPPALPSPPEPQPSVEPTAATTEEVFGGPGLGAPGLQGSPAAQRPAPADDAALRAHLDEVTGRLAQAEAVSQALAKREERARTAARTAAAAAKAAGEQAVTELTGLQRELQNATELVRAERARRAELEEALEHRGSELAAARELAASELAAARELAASELAEVKAEAEAVARAADEALSSAQTAAAQELTRIRDESAAELEQVRSQAQGQVQAAGEALKAAEATAEETRVELGLLSEEHQKLSADRDALKAYLADEQQKNRERNEAAAELEMKLLEQGEAADQLMRESTSEAERLKALLEAEREGHTASEEQVAALEAEVASLKETLATAQQREAELAGQLAQARAEREAAVARLEGQLTDATDASAKLTERAEKAQAERAAAQAELTAAQQELAEAEAERARAEAEAAAAAAHARELEDRAIMPLSPEGKPPLGVPRMGQLTVGELARLVAQLVIAQVEVKLELAVTGGTRSLWLRRGQLAAAESTLPYETLSDRARRDGLIDGRQETELRSVRGASPAELLMVMRERALLREAETVPLVQRYTEQVALDAFSESQCSYRITDEAPPPEVLAAAAPRPTLPLVAESLRRALSPDAVLELLGGSDAVPEGLDTDLDARALGFSERERRMLGFVDGEATVEMLVMAAGLKADTAYKALLVAKLLGLIEVRAPSGRAPAPSPELDVQRLDAKYDQVQEADYFSILGLPRNAGTDEVQRAFERLSAEFDPIRFSGHPDASLQQRAQVVHTLLEEAAKALEDDRRRAEYARHLLD